MKPSISPRESASFPSGSVQKVSSYRFLALGALLAVAVSAPGAECFVPARLAQPHTCKFFL